MKRSAQPSASAEPAEFTSFWPDLRPGERLPSACSFAELQGAVTLVPFLILAATFELNFFVHTGVERIGRYIQVFFEEAGDSRGWETTAMNYGTRFAVLG